MVIDYHRCEWGGGGVEAALIFRTQLDRSPTPVPIPTETPYPLPQVGERFDGLQGNPYVTFFKNADGSTQMKVNMNIKPPINGLAAFPESNRRCLAESKHITNCLSEYGKHYQY
jgi:hypothetical protein